MADSSDAVADCPEDLDVGQFVLSHVLNHERRIGAVLDRVETSHKVGFPEERQVVDDVDNDDGGTSIPVPVFQGDSDHLFPRLFPRHGQCAGYRIELDCTGNEGHRRGPDLFIWVVDVGHPVEQLKGDPVADLDRELVDSGQVDAGRIVDVEDVEGDYGVRELDAVTGPDGDFGDSGGIIVERADGERVAGDACIDQ